MAGFTYQGASGALYNFILIDMTNPKVLPWHGGVFVFAKYTPEPFFIGEGQNLFEAINAHHSEWTQTGMLKPKDGYQIPVAYILLEDDAEKRAAAVVDLVGKYHPPLNQ